MGIKTSEDLIKRSDAITAVAQLCAWHGSEGAWVLQEDVIEALENVTPNESKQEWIPCSERLPEKYDYYLVTAKNHKNDDTYLVISWFQGYWFTDAIAIAWMPLPELYKESE